MFGLGPNLVALILLWIIWKLILQTESHIGSFLSDVGQSSGSMRFFCNYQIQMWLSLKLYQYSQISNNPTQ